MSGISFQIAMLAAAVSSLSLNDGNKFGAVVWMAACFGNLIAAWRFRGRPNL